MSSLRQGARRALFAVMAVAACLVLVEGGLRVAGYRPLPTRPVTSNPDLLFQYGKFRSSPTLIWELVPGWSGREGMGTVRISSQGLREREVARPKPPGLFRILCLGDSVAFGHWVEAEQAFPRRLEEILVRQAGRRVEVINAGVPGYSTFQELAWLEAEGWSYEPDLVLLGFVLNDVVERYHTLAAYGGGNTILGVDTTVTLGPLQRLVRRTAFHRFVTSLMLAGERRREVYSVRRLFDADLTPEVRAAWELTETEMDAMAAAARRRGVPLWVAVFPFRFQVAEDLAPRPQERLAAWGRRAGVPVIDLAPVFARLGPGGFLDHDHPTPEGHDAAARALAGALLAEGALDGARS